MMVTNKPNKYDTTLEANCANKNSDNNSDTDSTATNIVASLLEQQQQDDDEGVKRTKLKKYYRKQAENYKHLYTDDFNDDVPITAVDHIAIDYEYIPATIEHSQIPVSLAIAFNGISPEHPLIKHQGMRKPYDDLPHLLLNTTLNLPLCLGIVVVKECLQYPNVASDSENYCVTFVFDCRGYFSGLESFTIFQIMLSNIKYTTGLGVHNYDILHEKDFTDGYLEQNTKIYVTYSEAELSCWFPDIDNQRAYLKLVRDYNIKDVNKTTFPTIQGTTRVNNLWLCYFNPHEGESCSVTHINTVDVVDTRCYNGYSVPKMGKSVGFNKLSGFDFEEHNADYYLEQDPIRFILYNAIDANLSLGIIYIKEKFIDVITEATQQDVIEPQYRDATKKHQGMDWEAIGELKQTVPSLSSVLFFANMRKKGLFDKDCKIGKPEGVFVKSQRKIKNELALDFLKIKGGINQRTDGTIIPQFFSEVKQYDAKSMYPTMWTSGLRVPLYPPDCLGKINSISVSDFLEMMSSYDYFTIKASFEFPKNTPKLQRLILQHEGGKCFVARKYDLQVLTPFEVEYININFPDMILHIHSGWYFDPQSVEPKNRHYICMDEVCNFLFDVRKRYKNIDALMEDASKLMNNGGSYGKFAQSKEQVDSEAYENAIINDGTLDGIGTKKDGAGILSHPVVANAVTGSARALNALVAMKHNAHHCVTDSVVVDGDVNFDLNKCLTGQRFLDPIVKASYYEDECKGYNYMMILCGVRGKALIPRNVELQDGGNSNEIESLMPCLDNDDKVLRVKNIIEELARQMSDEIITIPKFARDGVKYEGSDSEQWKLCATDCVDRFYGVLLEKEVKHLLKRNEVFSGKTRYKYVNAEITQTRMLDCVDVGSWDFEDGNEYQQIMNMKQKCRDINGKKGKDYRSFGEAYRFYYDEWEERFGRSKSRNKPSQKVPNEWKRTFIFLIDIGILSQSEVAKIIGTSQRVISHWKQSLVNSENYQLWFKDVFQKLAKHKTMDIISENCTFDATGALERSSLKGLVDETFAKRASNVVDALLVKVEKAYDCKFKARSKRSKKLIVEMVA